jgi:serine/threonine protein kinase
MSGRLGRYVLLKHLASGGMADVFLGRSDGIEGFERHVVIKRIRPALAGDQRFIRMFLDEARVAATLHHQHIVQVYDIGEADGEYFIAMEYVHGEDVRKLLANAGRRRTHMPLGYAMAIVSAAAAALHHAHEQRGSDRRPLDIVHRDVSPSNIVVGYDGGIKLLDFGIVSASTLRETRSGSLKGKLSYMSPEQCKGLAVDRRTDIYALGAVLYELATTARMIRGDTDYQVMDQVVHGRIIPPQNRRPELPPELVDIIMRALATERDDRYSSCDELRVALDQCAANAGLSSSSAAISTYMHKQFGDRPEPWLDIDGQGEVRLETMPSRVYDAASTNGWTEVPRSDGDVRRPGGTRDIGGARDTSGVLRTGSIPRSSGRLPTLVSAMGTSVAARDTPLPPQEAPPSPRTPPADAGTPWDGQPHARVIGGFAFGKTALIAAVPFVAVTVLLIVLSLRTDAMPIPDPPVAVSSPPAAAVLPAAAPLSTSPQGAQVVTVATVATVARRGNAMTGSEPSQPRKPSSAATPATGRNTPSSSTERSRPTPTRASAVTAADPAPRGADSRSADEAYRPTAVPPAPPSPSSSPTPSSSPAALPPVPAAAMASPVPVAATTPVAAAAPQLVAPTTLEANRIAGDKAIMPDSATMDAISHWGADKIVSAYKVCVTAAGTIDLVTQVKASGFPAYDEKIRTTIRQDWRYRPYVANGKAQAVCTTMRFVYSQK